MTTKSNLLLKIEFLKMTHILIETIVARTGLFKFKRSYNSMVSSMFGTTNMTLNFLFQLSNKEYLICIHKSGTLISIIWVVYSRTAYTNMTSNKKNIWIMLQKPSIEKHCRVSEPLRIVYLLKQDVERHHWNTGTICHAQNEFVKHATWTKQKTKTIITCVSGLSRNKEQML